jgi:hypothetical protein
MTCPDCEYHKQRAAMTCPECERLRITVERYKLSAGMWRNKCYELGGTPLPWEPEELIKRAVEAEREACAKVCEGLSGRSYEFDMGRLHSAAAIRARGG